MPHKGLDASVCRIEKFTVRGFATKAWAPCCLMVGLAGACTVPNPNANADESSSESTGSTTLEDESESGASSESEGCDPGSLGCECLDGACESGLSCVEGLCEEPSCGNGVVEPPEECDEGEANDNEGACKVDCNFNVCGDGYVGPEEQCDDVNLDEEDGCRSNCLLTDSPTCGDGRVDAGEFCYEVFFEPLAPDPIVALSSGDVDQDGDVDLIAAMGDGAELRVAVLLAPFEAGASFEAAIVATEQSQLAGEIPKDLVAGRFGTDDGLHLLVNYSDGLYSALEEYRFEDGQLSALAPLDTTSWNLSFRALADFGPEQPQLALYSNDNTFSLVLAQGVDPTYEFSVFAQDARTARRGSDSADNIYAVDPSGLLFVYERQGLELVELTELSAAPAEWIAPLDLDGDGLDGAALANVPACPAGPPDLCDPTQITFFRGAADDEMPLVAEPKVALPALPGATALRAIEANGDSLEDLLVVSDTKAELQILETDPELSGKWQRTLPLGSFGQLGRLVVDDFNGDGVDDIVLHDAAERDLRVMLSNP